MPDPHKHVRIDTTFDADGDNTAQVGSANPCRLLSAVVSNLDDADAFLQLFDAAAADVTVGTTTPKLGILVPAGNGTKRGAFELTLSPHGIDFRTALTYACTTTATGNTDPTTGLTVNLIYTDN